MAAQKHLEKTIQNGKSTEPRKLSTLANILDVI